MNHKIPCSALLLLVLTPLTGWSPSGTCDYSLGVPYMNTVTPGGNITWPMTFTHLWGDPAIGTWSLSKSGCPMLTYSPGNGSFSVSSGGSQIKNVSVAVAVTTCARELAVLTASSSACNKSKTSSGKICVVPTGETTFFVTPWFIYDGADFRVKLDPATADFSDRVVEEVHVNPTDGCRSGPLPSFGAGVGSSWTILAGNEYNNVDRIGYGGNYPYITARSYIVTNNLAPCRNDETQQMRIYCDAAYYVYEEHPLAWWVDDNGAFFVERDGLTGGPY